MTTAQMLVRENPKTPIDRLAGGTAMRTFARYFSVSDTAQIPKILC